MSDNKEALPVLGYLLRSGHGTHFAEHLSPEHKAMTFGGRPIWAPVTDHATATAALKEAQK